MIRIGIEPLDEPADDGVERGDDEGRMPRAHRVIVRARRAPVNARAAEAAAYDAPRATNWFHDIGGSVVLSTIWMQPGTGQTR